MPIACHNYILHECTFVNDLKNVQTVKGNLLHVIQYMAHGCTFAYDS